MSRDLLLGETPRTWSRGSLPAGARGYAPRKWWTEAEAEAEVCRQMERGGTFGGKLPRDAAERAVADLMRARKIGVQTSAGSILLPASQQRAIFSKLDDVRYDLRQAGRNVGATVLVLSAALGAVALASVYRTSSGR
jgi:hypothetical protein